MRPTRTVVSHTSSRLTCTSDFLRSDSVLSANQWPCYFEIVARDHRNQILCVRCGPRGIRICSATSCHLRRVPPGLPLRSSSGNQFQGHGLVMTRGLAYQFVPFSEAFMFDGGKPGKRKLFSFTTISHYRYLQHKYRTAYRNCSSSFAQPLDGPGLPPWKFELGKEFIPSS